MKQQIHPAYQAMTVRCACGTTYETFGAAPELSVEICQSCSPLFTGTEEKRVIMGQVEKFLKRTQKQTKPKTKKAKQKIGSSKPSRSVGF